VSTPLDPAAEPALDPIVRDEEAQLARVARLLAEVPWEAPPKEADLVAELVRLREELATAKEEDKGSLMEQYNQQLAHLEQLRGSRERGHIDPASPYFAHLRLRENGRSRDLFLGKATRIDHGLRIVDWRNAPISRVFYAYRQGDEYEEEMGDRWVEGVVEARRTVTIGQGALRRIDSPEGVFERRDDGWARRDRDAVRLAGGQGASGVATLHGRDAGGRLGARGGVRADKHLPDIAGLIDPEQFALITRPSAGFVVIRGTAGSGKTTVALHRIAWLAYQDARIDSPSTLFLVFSRALRDYVSRVLPSLGVHHVRVLTFPEWASGLRRRAFPKLPRATRDDTPALVSRLKLHPAMMVALEAQVRDVSGPATVEQAIDDWASVTTQPDVLWPVLEALAPGAFDRRAVDNACQWARDRFDEWLAWQDGDREVRPALDAEDDALLLRAHQLRVGPLREGRGPLAYRHVAIDEVQDFSPVEVRVLLDSLDARRSITLAGDTQQHVLADAGFTSWADFFRWLGVPGTSVDTLRVAYRSSRPIVDFAQRVLGPLAEDDTPPATVRDGPPVELFPFTDHGQAVAALAEALQDLAVHEPLANVALVVPDDALAEIYAEGLTAALLPRVRRVTDEDFSFAPGVEVVPVSQVKGLEFDYVVVVEASAAFYPDTPRARRLLHVAATRAIHQLWLTSVGTLSPIVREALGG
jgi:DNA helicase-2/ATP-dependent DNA helicase PcrA